MFKVTKPAPNQTNTTSQAPAVKPGIPRFGTVSNGNPVSDDSYLLNQITSARLQIPYISPGNYILCVTESKRAASANPMTKGATVFSMRFVVMWVQKTDKDMPIGKGKQCAVVYKCGIPGIAAEIASGNYLQHLATMYPGLSAEQLLALGPEKISELNSEWASDVYSGQLLYCEAKTVRTGKGKEITRYTWEHIPEETSAVATRKALLEKGEVPELPEEIRKVVEN